MKKVGATEDEDGFTLTELLVAMGIMSVVLAVILSGFISVTRTTTEASQKSQALTDARRALEVIARDLRAANPIDPASPVTNYDTRVSFSIHCSDPGVDDCSANGLRPIRYRVENNELIRTIGGDDVVLVGPTGPPSQPRALQRGAVVNSTSPAVFTYLDRNRTVLATSGATPALPTRFRDCVRSVQIRLAIVSEAGRSDNAVDLSTEVELRNFNDIAGCP